jgi:hypothetical protein
VPALFKGWAEPILSDLRMSGALSADASSQAASQNTIVKRTLCVHVVGSLSNLALAGPQAALWKAVPGTETEIFCPSLESGMNPDEQVDLIRNGLIRSVTVKEAQSTFPCPLGVTISCVPSNEVTDLGDRYAYTVLPNSTITSPQTIYTCDTSIQENAAWRQQYGKWNKQNLEKEGVIDVPNQPFYFVHMSHPAIGLLRHNADMIGCDIEKQPMVDKQWFKITRQVMGECCKTLRSQVLNKVKTEDMNLFTFQLHRLGAEAWDDLGDGTVALQGFKKKAKWTAAEYEQNRKVHLENFITDKYQYIARLEVEYEVPSAAITAAAA